MIHFGTPCYGGQLSEVCFQGYLKWTILAMQNDIGFTVDTLSNESNINRGRNSIAAKFLAGDATHLMFVDSDIQWQPEHVIKLVKSDKDMVGGVYPSKSIPVKHVVNTIDNGKIDGDLLEVGTMGTGFLLIKRTVFEQMIKAGAQKYTDDIGLGPEFDDHQYDFFNCTIDSQGRYLTEDWSFCRRWRQLGGEVWADTSIELGHVGYHRFMPDIHTLRREYGIS
tara:strand:+ start:473 stop:1141 length:669 start_codon:yes stop_codon:yes gene_type:complete